MSFLQEYKQAYKILRTGRTDTNLIKRIKGGFFEPGLRDKTKNVDRFNPVSAGIGAFSLVFAMRKSRKMVNVLIGEKEEYQKTHKNEFRSSNPRGPLTDEQHKVVKSENDTHHVTKVYKDDVLVKEVHKPKDAQA